MRRPNPKWTAFIAALALAACQSGGGGEPVKPGSSHKRPGAPADASSVRALIDKDGRSWELAVQLADAPDLATELAELDEAEPESFRFNSVLGGQDGIALGDVADGESLDAAMARLRLDPRVRSVEPLVEAKALWAPNDPKYALQWNLKAIGADKAWEQSRGKGVVVAVIDTGVAYRAQGEWKQVPDLAKTKFVPGYDFVNDTDTPVDDNGHGTHVAGTVAQSTDNGEGVAGVAFEAAIMPLKVLDASGAGNSADIVEAIRWAADHGANVINMSLGGGAPSQMMADAIAHARKKGVTVVAAAGNASREVVEFPAAYEGVIAVSATRFDGQLAPYSSFGEEVDIAAPGGDKSVDQNGDGQPDGILQDTIDPLNPGEHSYEWFQGTSMASPHVAGVAALLIAAGASTPEQVEQALFHGAQSHGLAWNSRTGHGPLDAAASLASLKGRSADEAPAAGNNVPHATTFESVIRLALSALFLGGLFATLRKRQRPPVGGPLVMAMALSAAGLFFIPAPESSAGANGVLALAELPIPDWGRWLFGNGKASPLFYSALFPLLFAFLGYRVPAMRQFAGGLSVGFAAFLAHAALSGAPGLQWMPFTFIAAPFLWSQVVLCLFMARALLMKREAV